MFNHKDNPTKVSPTKEHKGSTPVSQSNQKKTHAVVAKSDEGGEELSGSSSGNLDFIVEVIVQGTVYQRLF